MEYREYQHVVKMDDPEVQGLIVGKCYIFPKIDGTNASLWWDDENFILGAGSRRRRLRLDSDNAGFYNAMIKDKQIEWFFAENPHLRLYGEWLVPHTLKTYRDDAWRKFYVFDVTTTDPEYESEIYLPYDRYKPIMDTFELNYITPLKIITDPTHEDLMRCVETNTFLIQEDKGVGEGIVIKNYDFVNQFGRITWGKIVRNDFKDKLHKEQGAPEMTRTFIEKELVDKFFTPDIVDKVFANIKLECGTFEKKMIPRLLETSYYDFVREEIWSMVKYAKANKIRSIDFTTLKQHACNKVKEYYPQIFRRTIQ